MKQHCISHMGRATLWTGLVLSSLAFGQTPANFTYTYVGMPLPIPVQDTGVGLLMGVTVPRGIYIQKVTVTVDIAYPQVGDLNVFLFSPEGTRTKLVEKNCGRQGTLSNITFDDSAPTKYSDVCPAESGGSWQGNEPLSNFSGQYAIGLWTLFVQNNGSNDNFGWAVSYSITITGSLTPLPSTSSLKSRSAVTTGPLFSPQTVVNQASLERGPIAPGEIISIFGLQLGPTPPVSAPAGASLPTNLGGVSVMIGGTTAPITYASFLRVNAVVPTFLPPGTTTTIVVTSNGQASKSISVGVSSSAVGILTRSPVGDGDAIVFNTDSNENKEGSGAATGSQVKVRAVGLGATSPPVPDGEPPPAPGPAVSTTVSASIAGVPATVVSAALVPGLPGVYEVTLMVPNGIPSGAVPLVITTPTGASQKGVRMWVQ